MFNDFDLDEDLTTDAFDDIKNINLDDIQKFTSQKLCDIIICYRYLGLNKDLSLLCMEELSRRRVNGDSFEFESYIDSSIKDLPVINSNIDLSSILSQFSGKNSK